LSVLVRLAETLDHVHGRRILHRDIKPANVLLVPGNPPWPKLADFGIVHLVDDEAGRLTDTGALLGSIDFMAPEQVESKPLDPRCDLYSLGCLIYVLWAGQPPFTGTPLQRLRMRFDREAPPLRAVAPHAPARLEALVARLLRRERFERPANAQEVARELSVILAEVQGGAALRGGEAARRAEPDDPASLEQSSDALQIAGRPRESIALLRELCTRDAPVVTRVRWMRKLGVALLRTSNVADGLAMLKRALSLLGDEVPSRRRRRWLRMVRDSVLTALRQILGRGAAYDPADAERAVIHRELAMIHRWIDADHAAFHLVAFIRLAHRLGVDAYRVEAYLFTAFFFSTRASPRLAKLYCGKARALALETGDMQGITRCEIVLGAVETSVGRDESATMRRFDEGLRVAEAVGDRFLINFALLARGWAGMLLGHARQSMEDFRSAGAIAAELDIPWLRDDAACGLSMIRLLYGEFESSALSMRSVSASDMRLALPLFEALPVEVRGAEAFLSGRFREAVTCFERARAHYKAHNLYSGWGTLAKLVHGEALICLADEEGHQTVPDLLDKLRSNARMGRRMSRLWLFRGWGSLLTGVYRARRGDSKAARALFDRALAERGSASNLSFSDLWFKVRIAFERWRLGDPREEVAPVLDGADAAFEAVGFAGMRSLLKRTREAHGV
jgi:tetratricopeptide (TPR) repeat protein